MPGCLLCCVCLPRCGLPGRPRGLESCGSRIQDLEPDAHPVWTLVSLKEEAAFTAECDVMEQ